MKKMKKTVYLLLVTLLRLLVSFVLHVVFLTYHTAWVMPA